MKNSLKKVYKGEKCYIYIVDKETSHFEQGQTSYPAEVVDGTGKEVKILKCYEVDDIYELLLKFHNANLIHLRFYKDYDEKSKKQNTEYQKQLLERIDAFNPEKQHLGIVKKCLRDYTDAINEIKASKSL